MHSAYRVALLVVCITMLGFPALLQAQNPPATQVKPGQGVWRNYDFVPGRTVLYSSDFSREPVGRFPASQLEIERGNAQIVEVSGQKVLEISENTVFRAKVPKTVDGGFTLEFSYLLPTPNLVLNVFFGSPQTAFSRWPSHYISISQRPGIYKGGVSVSSIIARQIVGNMTEFKFQFDQNTGILYAGPERAGNFPSVSIEPWNVIEFQVRANDRFRAYLTDIVIAEGVAPMYETLMEEGAYTTRGILFAVDKADVQPGSTLELTRIIELLAREPNIRLTIEGHTDNRGDETHNMDLSQRRANAIVDYLADEGVSRDRLEAIGKGASSPTTSNDTPQGRAQNRRVVVRLKNNP